MNDNDAVIFCVPVHELSIPYVPAKQVPCVLCGVEVWLSHETVEGVRRRWPLIVLRPHCIGCGEAVVQATGATPVILPEQEKYLPRSRQRPR